MAQQNTCPQPDLLLVDSIPREWQASYKKCSTAFFSPYLCLFRSIRRTRHGAGTCILWLLLSSLPFTAKIIHSIITMRAPCVWKELISDDGSFSSASICLSVCKVLSVCPQRVRAKPNQDDASLKSRFPVEFTLSVLSSTNCISACIAAFLRIPQTNTTEPPLSLAQLLFSILSACCKLNFFPMIMSFTLSFGICLFAITRFLIMQHFVSCFVFGEKTQNSACPQTCFWQPQRWSPIEGKIFTKIQLQRGKNTLDL